MIRPARAVALAMNLAAGSVAALLVIGAPAVYFTLAYQYMCGALDTEAEVSARAVSQLVVTNPKMWVFEQVRLAEMLERRWSGIPEVRRILDGTGAVLAEHADPLAPPLLARRHAVYDAGREVAKLEVSRSLRPLLLDTSLVLAVALLAAGLAVLALRVLPMRAVDRAHAALERTEAERRRLQERLLHAEKLESVGRLAGGVAHDFNNILTVILSFARELTEELAGEPREHAREIERAALRGAAVTRQLLAFGRKQVLYPEVLKMEEVVAGLGSMIGRLVGERVTVALDVAPDVGLVRMDPTQLEQAIVNLSLNARDAMPDGGRLSIGARNVDVAPGADAAAGSAPGQYVAVSVRDTGTGMDATTLSRIFEPFYTTKPMGKGTGLGLSIVHGAVEQSGGHIGVESTPGAGTAFTLYLPRAAAA